MAKIKTENANVTDGVCANGTFGEKHFSPKELAALWGLSAYFVRKLFYHEEGVLLLPSRNPRRSLRANYNTMLIPESVAKRVHASYSVGKRNANRYG